MPCLKQDLHYPEVGITKHTCDTVQQSSFPNAVVSLCRTSNTSNSGIENQVVNHYCVSFFSGDAGQLGEALSSVLRTHTAPSGPATHLLRCCADATSVLPGLPPCRQLFPGHCFPGQLLQQLAAIITAWDRPGQALALQVIAVLVLSQV